MAKFISVCNHKGGVAKTTTAVNLAHGLARAGRKTLLADLATPSFCSHELGILFSTGITYSMVCGQKFPLQLFTRDTGRPNLDLMPGNPNILLLQNTSYAQDVLPRVIKFCLDTLYDFVVFDNSPAWNDLQSLSISVSDHVLVPTDLTTWSLFSTREQVAEAEKIGQKHGWTGKVHILPVMIPDQLSETEEKIMASLRSDFSVLSPIHKSAALAEYPRGKTFFEYAPESRLAAEYAQLTEWVISAIN